MATVAIWSSGGALLLCAFLLVPFGARGDVLFLVLLAAAAVSAVAGLVLGITARWPRAALAAALLALLIDIALLLIFVIGMATLHPQLNQVKVSGYGPVNTEARYAHEDETTTVLWGTGGYATFPTTGSWAEVVVEAPADQPTATVACQITWNGESVADETATGSVTCRYDAD